MAGSQPAALGVAPGNRLRLFWQSTVGKKVVMSVTGLIMVGFVIVHMIGNLQVFEGAARLNAYSHFLHHTVNELLWLVRVVLLASVVLHIVAAVQLTRIDRAARPVGYRRREPQAATVASRSMRWGGVALALFVVFHLLHLTTGTIQPVAFVDGDVYANVVGGFRIWWVTLIYVLAMIALGLHIFHGAWSSIRTLGVNRPRGEPMRRPVAALMAVVVWAGFSLVPLAVFFGWVR
ncbi:MAG TPA: succinate dehydrogenase cytochrome b subunit [Gemmatimonadaceae bacterium]|nr:succinate dehydrogenase cytochrome b subunit [Gemmatimonadaceae bacterium]